MLLIGEDTLQVLEARFDQEWMNCKMCSVTPSVVLVFLSHPSTFLGLNAFVLPFSVTEHLFAWM